MVAVVDGAAGIGRYLLRRPAAEVDDVEDGWVGSGGLGLIPPVGKERRMRASSLWSSILPGKLLPAASRRRP